MGGIRKVKFFGKEIHIQEKNKRGYTKKDMDSLYPGESSDHFTKTTAKPQNKYVKRKCKLCKIVTRPDSYFYCERHYIQWKQQTQTYWDMGGDYGFSRRNFRKTSSSGE